MLASHLGRPDGREPELSMAPVAARLGELIGAEVRTAPGLVGAEVEAAARRSSSGGEVLVLENSRYEPGETDNDPELAAALARLGDLYVDDAFGAAHRAHATTHGVARELPGLRRPAARARGPRADRRSRRPGPAAVRGARRGQGLRQARA